MEFYEKPAMWCALIRADEWTDGHGEASRTSRRKELVGRNWVGKAWWESVLMQTAPIKWKPRRKKGNFQENNESQMLWKDAMPARLNRLCPGHPRWTKPSHNRTPDTCVRISVTRSVFVTRLWLDVWRHESVWRGSKVKRILDMNTRWSWVASFTLRTIDYLQILPGTTVPAAKSSVIWSVNSTIYVGEC